MRKLDDIVFWMKATEWGHYTKQFLLKSGSVALSLILGSLIFKAGGAWAESRISVGTAKIVKQDPEWEKIYLKKMKELGKQFEENKR